MEMQEQKLRCKMSTFQTDLSYNEWVSKYNVSSRHYEPTKYFQGNPSSGYVPLDERTEPLFKRIGESFARLINSIPLPF